MADFPRQKKQLYFGNVGVSRTHFVTRCLNGEPRRVDTGLLGMVRLDGGRVCVRLWIAIACVPRYTTIRAHGSAGNAYLQVYNFSLPSLPLLCHVVFRCHSCNLLLFQLSGYCFSSEFTQSSKASHKTSSRYRRNYQLTTHNHKDLFLKTETTTELSALYARTNIIISSCQARCRRKTKRQP
jgi:hypothetical protein